MSVMSLVLVILSVGAMLISPVELSEKFPLSGDLKTSCTFRVV